EDLVEALAEVAQHVIAVDASGLVDRDQGLLGFQGQLDGNEPTSGVQVIFARFVKDADVRQPVVALRLHDAINLADDEVGIVLAVVDAHRELPRPAASARHAR
ncbi:MAG: hypothetical protein AABZ70_18965, partial [candidate division NC10 bacterium]